MKKKIIIMTLGIMVFIFSIIFLLIYFQVIKNPFVNTDDLVCSRMNVTNKEVFLFEFDWLGKLKKAQKNDYVYFETVEEAQEYYNNNVEQMSSNIKLKDKTIIFEFDIINIHQNIGESRKKLLNDYSEFGFKCE